MPSEEQAEANGQKNAEEGEQKPADENEQKPADESEQKPADGSKQKPADGSEQMPADGSEQKPADGSEQKPAEENQKRPAEEREQKPVKKAKVTIRKCVADRIKLCNMSGELKQELRLGSVALALSKLDEKDSICVLDALLEAGDKAENPNTFVCKKAKELAQQRQAEAEEAAAAGEEEEPVENTPEARVKLRVEELSLGDALLEPIQYERLEPLVPLIGYKSFLPMLDQLEVGAEQIAKPTQWLRKQVMKRLGPVLQRCDTLNRSVPGRMDLLAPLDLPQVKEPLAKILPVKAFAILKELEEKVMEVEDPTAWVVEQALAAAGEAEAQESDDSPEARVKRRVKELSEGEALWEPIRYRNLKPLIPMVGHESFLQMLDKLEAGGEEIANPTTWLRRQMMKRLGPILNKCDQLNKSVPGRMDLLAPLDLPQLSEPLKKIPHAKAFEILKELEEKVFDIQDPTSWVLEQVEKQQPTGPVADEIERLNSTGALQKNLDMLQATTILSAVNEDLALQVLNRLAGRVATIRNPLGWLSAEVRQAAMAQPAVVEPLEGAPRPPELPPPGVPKAAVPEPPKPRLVPRQPSMPPPGFLGAPRPPPGAGAARPAGASPVTPPKRPPPTPPKGMPAFKRPKIEDEDDEHREVKEEVDDGEQECNEEEQDKKEPDIEDEQEDFDCHWALLGMSTTKLEAKTEPSGEDNHEGVAELHDDLQDVPIF